MAPGSKPPSGTKTRADGDLRCEHVQGLSIGGDAETGSTSSTPPDDRIYWKGGTRGGVERSAQKDADQWLVTTGSASFTTSGSERSEHADADSTPQPDLNYTAGTWNTAGWGGKSVSARCGQ